MTAVDPSHGRTHANGTPYTAHECWTEFGEPTEGYVPAPTDERGNLTGDATWLGVPVPGSDRAINEGAAPADGPAFTAHEQHVNRLLAQLHRLHSLHKK